MGAAESGHGIPPPPPESRRQRLRRRWRSTPKATKALASWVAFFIVVGLGLFAWVSVRGGSVAVAFNILTQQQAPIGSGLGAAGVLLGTFGFFVAPAIIGALVGAVFISSSQLSAQSVEKRMDEIRSELRRGREGRGR